MRAHASQSQPNRKGTLSEGTPAHPVLATTIPPYRKNKDQASQSEPSITPTSRKTQNPAPEPTKTQTPVRK